MPASTLSPAPAEVARPQVVQREAVLRDHRPAAERGKPAESMFSAGDEATRRRAEAGLKRGAELERYKQEHADPREAMREGKPPTKSLSETEMKQLDRVNHDLAVEVQEFDRYSSVTEEAARTHRTTAEVCASRNPPIVQTEFDAEKKAVLERMARVDYIRSAIPGFEQMDPDTQLEAVNAFAGSHRGVREFYIGSMRDVARRALALPEAPPSQADQLKPRMDLLTAQQAQSAENVNKLLGLQGQSGPNQEIPGTVIDAAISRGDAGRATLDIYDAMLRNNGVTEPSLFRRHFQLERQIAQMKAQGRPETEIQPLVAEITQVGQTLQFEQRGAEFRALEARLNGQVYGEPNPAGVRVGGIETQVQRMVQTSQEMDALKRQATAPVELTAEQQRAQAERTVMIEQMRDEMASGMESSVQKAFLRDYDDLAETNRIKAEADATDAAEKGDVRRAEAIRIVHKNQEQHGVHLDAKTGRTVVNRPDIGRDVIRIAQDGDEGVRRIELRNLSEGEHPVIQLYETDDRGVVIRYDTKGVPTTDGTGEPRAKYYIDQQGVACKSDTPGARAATWETVRYDQLTPEDRKLMDEIHAGQADRIAQKVMADYFFGLKPPIKQVDQLGSTKDLVLTKGQEASLGRFFGQEGIKAAFADSRDYDTFKNILKEKGIDPAHGGASLLMILFSLFSGVGGPFRRKDESSQLEI